MSLTHLNYNNDFTHIFANLSETLTGNTYHEVGIGECLS
jgi:hypothetical protein